MAHMFNQRLFILYVILLHPLASSSLVCYDNTSDTVYTYMLANQMLILIFVVVPYFNFDSDVSE